MRSATLLALAAAGLVGQSVASPHQHAARHPHNKNKRAYTTEVVTVTEWLTVTVYEGDTPQDRTTYTSWSVSPTSEATSEATTPSPEAEPKPKAANLPPPPPPPQEPTTLATIVAPAVPKPEQSSPAEVKDTPPPPPPPPPATPTTEAAQPPAPTVDESNDNSGNNGNGGDNGSGGNNGSGGDNGNNPGPVNPGAGTSGKSKRGLAYNDPALLHHFLHENNKISWTYNWGQYDDSGVDLEFCPMLWGLKLDFADRWPANAQKAIDNGSRCLLSFNEPDHGEQANLSPQTAAQKHIELMNPFRGKARISSPAITNGGGNMGIAWLKQWFEACGGACAVDFLSIHIYGVNPETFLQHVRNVYDTFGLPIWITEFGFDGSDEEVNKQLATVIDAIENNPEFSYVERFAYFYAADGHMVRGNSLSVYGNTYAYSA
ncbi:hypothetical protein VTJ83DRAFT_6765 [Remersonia thermophila]|uniref:Asl1-like glycosyl hydrolase catalytic domain-containing protein n=1 Tax=Remersonia thermophila TaxID=72144 RepID=A0ABR4D6G7_9PEZI